MVSDSRAGFPSHSFCRVRVQSFPPGHSTAHFSHDHLVATLARAAADWIHTRQEARQRGLARPARSHEGDPVAGISCINW